MAQWKHLIRGGHTLPPRAPPMQGWGLYFYKRDSTSHCAKIGRFRKKPVDLLKLVKKLRQIEE